ncbi:hypothetical protein PUNSTDRAFT_97471 [Punctularia strigosozonata HHB-11173 SS5]|uniref:uncharacterized protein n=1 Tax=Punctularia strigosozonata (strain HHB-11173) TaxID=741275 RepID=UPI0004416C41|nr:uncharacterized protein PUNSTDRAFT_97471 [Punctularia strigosozonata HHB-11173 SS5]EIN12656.1 hypothetical protein PUNSTDRAFT_97471 [Punctularia strigosozonata HHB-11173 SS5]
MANPDPVDPAAVPLGTGPPTKAELVAHYPAKFTWRQLKAFVNSGDLGLLKRDKQLQQRYDQWSVGIKQEYGSMVNYLLQKRLRWGEPDTQAAIRSVLDDDPDAYRGGRPDVAAAPVTPLVTQDVVTLPAEENLPEPPLAFQHEYFTADTPSELLSVIQNDWPYSVPPEVEHTLIWTKLPIVHDALVPASIRARIHQDGLWGFTGTPPDDPPPSPSHVTDALPALAEWGVTPDKLVRSPRGTDEEEALVRRAGREVQEFVKRRWDERVWETAWFVNPQRLQSIPGLAHIHVFARRKDI